MGGTGYAKDGAPIQWGEYAYAVGHSAAALGAGVLGVGDLAVGTKGLGLAALVVFGFEIAQANENNAHFSRSIDANRRYWSWQ